MINLYNIVHSILMNSLFGHYYILFLDLGKKHFYSMLLSFKYFYLDNIKEI